MRKNSSEMIKEYLARGGRVESCKDFNPSSFNKPKRAKNKNFVSDKEFSTGHRTGSAV